MAEECVCREETGESIVNVSPENFRFPKSSRLHHRSLVEKLFRLGKSFYEFPFRVTWMILSPQELRDNFRNSVPAGIGKMQVLVTIPKKKRRKAVDRVLLRRRTREAFRLNSAELKREVAMNENLGTLSIALVYIHNENLPYSNIEEKIKAIETKLCTKVKGWESY